MEAMRLVPAVAISLGSSPRHKDSATDRDDAAKSDLGYGLIVASYALIDVEARRLKPGMTVGLSTAFDGVSNASGLRPPMHECGRMCIAWETTLGCLNVNFKAIACFCLMTPLLAEASCEIYLEQNLNLP